MSFYILSPLPTTSGGTGTVVKPTAGQVPIGNADGTYTPGTPPPGTVTSVTGSGNIASSGGTTPNITFTGQLPTANGGTNLSSFTSGGVVYASSTSALATVSALTFDGTNLVNSQNTASPIGLVLNNVSASTSAGTRLTFKYGGSNTGYVGNQFDGGDFNNQYQANQFHIWLNGAAEQMRLTSTGLGIGTTSPSASAILDAQSTTKGVRMPNMTTTQKNAISSPAAGLMVFDTTLSKLCVYSGAAWQTITSV
jgi:hypothetical protein